MALFIYGTATNTGKGFFTHEDRRNFFLRGYGGHDGSNPIDVWVVGNNEKGADDIGRTAWDNNDVDGESADEKVARIGSKPGFITIP